MPTNICFNQAGMSVSLQDGATSCCSSGGATSAPQYRRITTVHTQHRPGNAPEQFSFTGGTVATTPFGLALRFTAPARLTPRAMTPLEPERLYAFRVAYSRSADSGDPANDGVQGGIDWLDVTGTLIASVMLFEDVDLTVASGRRREEFIVGAEGLDGAPGIVPPAGALGALPWVRIFGIGHQTGIEICDLAPLASGGTVIVAPPVEIAGGPTVSNNGVAVLPLSEFPSDINFADEAIGVADDLDGTVTVSLTAIGTGPLLKARRPITGKTASVTIIPAEEGHSLHFLNPLEVVATIPANAAQPVPIGAEYELVRMNAGPVQIVASLGVVLNGVEAGSTRIVLRYGGAVLRKIAADEWLVIGAIEEVTGEIIVPPPVLPVYYWDDVFTDHRATLVYDDNDAGLNWTGHGTTAAQPMEPAVEWFMNNVLPNEAPDGAIIELTSPTGTMHLRGRLQPPPTSKARNFTLDLTGNIIERGLGAEHWGQMFLWGMKTNDPAMASAATIGADSFAGDTILYLRDGDPDTESLLSLAVPGSIIEIRTNTTRANYHPDESRTTCFIAAVDPVAKTLTVQDPLLIDVPEENPVGSWETFDPSTVTLLQGSLLQSNAAAGSSTIVMASALGLAAGDWLVVGTGELPGHMKNQFMDFEPDANQIGPDLDITYPADYGDTLIPINEELHQIASITGNTVTLTSPLGKNKLVVWQAFAFKVDPIENLTLIGGTFLGNQNHGGAAAWDHQYIWCRYMVNSLIRDCNFDTDPARGLTLRRTGQAVRFDTGESSVMDNLTIGQPGDISAGNGYGVSFRRGERNSVIRNSYIELARHSIEFWSSGGGCVAEFNHCADDTSSSIDTHGNWNTGIIIRDNLVTRDGSRTQISADSDSTPDAIRIGNNKFIFDENVQVLRNRVIGYDGNALSIVPGCWDITVDDLEVDGVQRILNMKGNTRHIDLFMRDIVIRNVRAKNITDRIMDIRHNSHAGSRMQAKGLLLKDWTIGADGPVADHANTFGTEISGIQILHVEGMTLENFTVTNLNLQDEWALFLQETHSVNFINFSIDTAPGAGTHKGIYLRDADGISGAITINGLEPFNDAGDMRNPTLVYYATSSDTSSTAPSLTLTHDLGPTPNVSADDQPSTFILNLVNTA